MSRNYQELFRSTQSRLNPEGYQFEAKLNEDLASVNYSDVLKFVRLAMNAVDAKYTERTKEAGDRVKAHLRGGVSDVEFRYQGSVMTNTHIFGFSDIDLLAISSKFYHYASGRVNEILGNEIEKNKFYQSQIERLIEESKGLAYTGDSNQDLRKLRLDSESILLDVYDECDIDQPKAIKVTNKSLKRDVDVVIANWYDDVRSIIYGKGDHRGIQIYNKDTDRKESPDYPFISIQRINEKSAETSGRLKKMIRFLKNVKQASSHDVQLSSFDINAICFDIDKTKYLNLPYYELVAILYNQLSSLVSNKVHSDNLVSVDGREYIFRNDQGKLQNLRILMYEVESIYADLKAEYVYG